MLVKVEHLASCLRDAGSRAITRQLGNDVLADPQIAGMAEIVLQRFSRAVNLRTSLAS